jgi:hypothetical protein
MIARNIDSIDASLQVTVYADFRSVPAGYFDPAGNVGDLHRPARLRGHLAIEDSGICGVNCRAAQ